MDNQFLLRQRMGQVIRKFKPTGDCFRNAGRVAITDSSWTLCHGWVYGRDKLIGKIFQHAWLERVENGIHIARDVTHEKWLVDLHEFAADFYREVGNVHDVTEYDHEDVLIMLTSYGHWGPWNDATRTG